MTYITNAMSSPLLTMTVDGWRPRGRQLPLEELAARIRSAFMERGLPLPVLGAQTHFSLHQSLLSPQQWRDFATALYGDDWRLLLADVGDLSAYPACRRDWGTEHFAVAAQVMTAQGRLVFLVPDEVAWVNLSQLLSRLNREPDLLQQWQAESIKPPDCHHLIVLVQNRRWLQLLREAGAEVYWRCEIDCAAVPDGVAGAALPLIGFAGDADAALLPTLRALRCNGRVADKIESDDAESLHALVRMPAQYNDAAAFIERGHELLARCQFHPSTDIHLPPGDEADADARLRVLCERGITLRYGVTAPAVAFTRLRHELNVVHDKQFAGYILTVYDLAQRRRTCGRGSAASSMICYTLGLTNVDPIRYSLVFERFLAPEREDPPDIDLDFPWDERDAVFAAALQRYGSEHVAMVSTHLHYRKWSALREVARVHGKLRADITDVKRQVTQINRFGGQALLPRSWDTVFKQAEILCEAPRHYGLHPGGLIITRCPVTHIVPTHPSKKIINGEPLAAIAWEKDGAEDMGLLKIDILGNRSLAVVRDTIQDLADDGITIDEQRWQPQDDLATRKLIATGQTIGCFYIESPAMRQLNAKAGSGDFDRLIVHSSIVRPAANRWINDYLARLHHFNKTGEMKDAWFPHPMLKKLLSESFGILSYQEDVMLAAKELAGFSSQEQNYLRKSLGRTDTSERLQAVAERFKQGCRKHKIKESVIQLVWSMISSFAGYSFCKAHSASYAMVSFQCAYLKAHHPAYFMARVISNGGGFYDRSAYVEEARRMGIRIHGPCVLRSAYATRHECGGQAMRLGLHCVPLLHVAHAQEIVEESQRQAFRGFTELYIRCPMSMREYLALEEAGALNKLLQPYNQPRRRWLIRRVAQLFPREQIKPALRSYVEQYGYSDPLPPQRPDVPHLEIWRQRFNCIGCLPYRHPLCLWPATQRRRHYHCSDITAALKGHRVTLVVWSITAKQVEAVQKKDRRGRLLNEPRREAMSFVTFEDETGILESVWFPRPYQRYGHLLAERQPLQVTGKVQVEFNFVSLEVETAALLKV